MGELMNAAELVTLAPGEMLLEEVGEDFGDDE